MVSPNELRLVSNLTTLFGLFIALAFLVAGKSTFVNWSMAVFGFVTVTIRTYAIWNDLHESTSGNET